MDFKKEFKNKNVLLTGATKGLGYELLKNLKKFDCKIILLDRNNRKYNNKNSKVKIVHCDLQKISKIPNSMNDVLSITKKTLL